MYSFPMIQDLAQRGTPPPESSPPLELGKAFKRFWKGVPNDVCPDLPVDSTVPLVKEAIREVDKTQGPVTLLMSTKRGHAYLHVQKVMDWDELPPIAYSPRMQRRILESPLSFPILWLSSLGSGYSTIETEPLTTEVVEQRGSSNVSIFGKGKWPKADVVTVRSQPPYVEKGEIPFPITIHSFEAKTRAGHALTGTVLHMLVATRMGIYFCAIGASYQGAPLIGGPINNSLACSPLWGSWPTLVRNMRQNMLSTVFWLSLAQSVTLGTFSQKDLLRNTKTLYKEMPASEWLRQTGTQQLVLLGAPLRRLSWYYYWFAALFSGNWPKDKEKD
jgi:hypothetical protein